MRYWFECKKCHFILFPAWDSLIYINLVYEAPRMRVCGYSYQTRDKFQLANKFYLTPELLTPKITLQ